MSDGLNDAYHQQAGRIINLADFGAERFTGDPPPVKWLVGGNIPLGVPAVLAAMGDTGKSYTAMQLCLRVAMPPEGNLNFGIPILGGQVEAHGAAVFITSEDNESEVHRRLHALDPDERRRKYPGRLRLVALPDAGGPLPLFVSTRDGVQATPEWDMLCDQLAGVPDLKLLVLDPLSTFAQVELDADNRAAGFVAGKFSELATALGATVLATHHMRKQGEAPKTLAQARERIRGASNLVDGVRLAYALWPVDDDDGREICERLGIPFKIGGVVKGGVVKANGKASRAIAIYVRNEHGLLIDRTSTLESIRRNEPLLDELVVAVAEQAKAGHPLNHTGENGLFKQAHRLPESLRNMRRDPLEALAKRLLEDGRLIKCISKGSTAARVLDVPGGPFDLGTGEVVVGGAVANPSPKPPLRAV